MGDILTTGGGLITWEEMEQHGAARLCRGAFNKAIENIRVSPVIGEERRRKIAVYLKEVGTERIWEFKAQANEVTEHWWRDRGPLEAVITYNICNGYLEKAKKQDPPFGSVLQRVIIGKQKTSCTGNTMGSCTLQCNTSGGTGGASSTQQHNTFGNVKLHIGG
jgi:hypothetical protein